jgi:hypothetical protein
VLQYGANQFADAISTLQHVVGFAPDLGVAWSLLGLCEFETRNFADALIHLEKAQLLESKMTPRFSASPSIISDCCSCGRVALIARPICC